MIERNLSFRFAVEPITPRYRVQPPAIKTISAILSIVLRVITFHLVIAANAWRADLLTRFCVLSPFSTYTLIKVLLETKKKGRRFKIPGFRANSR